MRTTLCALIATISLLSACTKRSDVLVSAKSLSHPGYNEYVIRKGNNLCENNSYPSFKGKGMNFSVIFDSSAVYRTSEASNQMDINKLYGYSDGGTHHQENSARFGWRWNGKALDILAYCYVNGIRKSAFIGTAAIGQPGNYSLSIGQNAYVFVFNEKKVMIERFCTTDIFDGYVLLPYFGGDEPAPHDIRIHMKMFETVGQ